MGHTKVVCACGAVIMQCRCFSHEKTQEVRRDGCADCVAKKTRQMEHAMQTIAAVEKP